MSSESAIELPLGFRFSGYYAGIKSNASAKDISLVVSDYDAVAAGVYTQNQIVAAPVVNCQAKTPQSQARAVIVNSGNANACTGKQGLADAERMCQETAERVAAHTGSTLRADQVLVMSTGVIGHALPMPSVVDGIAQAAATLSETPASFWDSVDGILTTDQFRKVATRTVEIGGRSVRIVGMAKGAGMIGPNMATMLCTVLTDARLTSDRAQQMLEKVANCSFNNISVEGHTSTNDTMLLLANGASGVEVTGSDLQVFYEELKSLTIELAKMIPTDGEGASHLIEVVVTGAEDDAAARCVSESIASSNLVKTAIYGNDPNWGRIVSAAGYAGPKLDLSRLTLKLNNHVLFENGEPIDYAESEVSASIRDNPNTLVHLVVGSGVGACTHWTSDLTVEYVRFNSEYTT